MSCLIQGLVVSSFILLDSASFVSAFFYNYHFCLSVSSSSISPGDTFAPIPLSLTLLLSPSPIAFRLISQTHSFFSRSTVQLFRPLNLSLCVCVDICVYSMPRWDFLCVGDGSNIAVAILQKNPWRNERRERESVLFAGQYFCSSITSISPSDSASYSAALHGFMLSSCAVEADVEIQL